MAKPLSVSVEPKAPVPRYITATGPVESDNWKPGAPVSIKPVETVGFVFGSPFKLAVRLSSPTAVVAT